MTFMMMRLPSSDPTEIVMIERIPSCLNVSYIVVFESVGFSQIGAMFAKVEFATG